MDRRTASDVAGDGTATGTVLAVKAVVVAGLLTRDADSPTARILDAMLSGDLRFAVSIELLGEYRRVLLRRRIQSRHGLSGEDLDSVLEEIALNAVVASPIH